MFDDRGRCYAASPVQTPPAARQRDAAAALRLLLPGARHRLHAFLNARRLLVQTASRDLEQREVNLLVLQDVLVGKASVLGIPPGAIAIHESRERQVVDARPYPTQSGVVALGGGATIDDIKAPSTLTPLADRRIGAPHTRMTGLHRAHCGRECPFGGLRASVIPDAEAYVWLADGEQAGSDGFVEEPATSVGGASPTRCSGAARASGMSVGSPRCPRTRTITSGSSISVSVCHTVDRRAHRAAAGMTR